MKRKVAVVDDEELIRKMVCLIFEREGYEVVSADNGTDGLALVEREKPDIVLLDIIMPGLHGFEVCKRIKQNPALSKTKVVVTSAKSYKPDIDKAKQLGADAYLVKPAELGELLAVVDQLLAQKTPPT